MHWLKRDFGLVAVCAVVLAVLSGCTYERVVRDGWGPMRELAGSNSTGTGDRVERRSNRQSGSQEAHEAVGPLDLRQHTGMYTLQIGVYDREYGQGYQRAAEQAVAVLREQQEQAFYYHGPHRSMVTIGLFTDDDFVIQEGRWSYGSSIRALQERFPYNLRNGLTMVEKQGGVTLGEQASCLVRVP